MRRLLIPILTALTLSVGLLPAQQLKFAVTDLVGLEELNREFGAFVAVLQKATGYQIAFYPVTNRSAAAQALRFEKADFVLTGPAEYVVMRKLTDARAVVGFGRPDYYGLLVARRDSDIVLPSDLKGKKVALGSVGSTSKHLAPMQLIADYGLDPLKDCEIIHVSFPVAFAALKRGEVDAVGITYDKFDVMRQKEAESGGMPQGAWRVIGRGPDLPDDVLLAGAHVDPAIVEKVRAAFINHSQPLIEAILRGEDNQKFKGMQFKAAPADSAFNYIRAMYRTIGYPEYAEFVGD